MRVHSFLTNTGIIPPFPGDSSKSSENNSTKNLDGSIENAPDTEKKSCPSRLLSLVRSLEKEEKGSQEYENVIGETVHVFNHLIAVYSRHGLLQGDVDKAEQVLSHQSSISGVGRNGKKRRKASKNGGSDDLQIQQHENGLTALDGSNSQQQAETLIFTAILRIIAAAPSNSDAKISGNFDAVDQDRALLISLAAELCLAICHHIKVDNESDTCNLAEYELLAQHGKPILTGILKTIEIIKYDAIGKTQDRSHVNKCLTLIPWDQEVHVMPLVSSMRLAYALVGLFGTKLSRSTALLLELNSICWKFLTANNDSIQESAARLLSSLPLAGGVDRRSPSDIWSSGVLDTLKGLSTALETMAPLTKPTKKSSNIGNFDDFLQQWVHFVRKSISSETSRLACFYRFSRGLAKAFQYLLLQDGGGHSRSNMALFDARVDIGMVLTVVESFVSFPLLSETVYFRTKRRLRNEIIDNGLLSPRTIATEIANHIKLMGHEILDSILDAIGGSPLLPYARRIVRITYASILTSSSSPVRKVMDPTSAAQLEGKKRRWLHHSISSRSRTIRTFQRVLVAFGCDRNEKSLTSSTTSSDGEKAMTLVVGSLVEQINLNKGQIGDSDDDWGTTSERVELIHEATNCLNAALASCGGFIVQPIRSLIESVLVDALSKLGNQPHLVQTLSWAPVKIGILQLACSCVSTPWQDGASSSLVQILTSTSLRMIQDVDLEVSLVAKNAIRLCETIGVPRAPALMYVTRGVSGSGADVQGASGPTDASGLAEKIESARKDAIESRKRLEEAELARKRKLEEKRQAQEEREKQKQNAKRQRAQTQKLDVEPKTAPSNTTEEASGAVGPSTEEAKKDPREKSSTSNQVSQISDDGTRNDERWKQEEKEEKDNEDKTDDASMKSGSDGDDELPEIFDDGPDSDDE